MISLQLLAIVIGLTALYMTYLYYRRKEFTRFELSTWLIIWLSFIFVSISPRTFDFLLETFAISRTMDLIMIIAFIILFILSFENYITNRRIQRKMESLVRDEALKGLDRAQQESKTV